MAIYKEVSQRTENPGTRSFGVRFQVSPMDRMVPYDLHGKLPGTDQQTFFTVSAPFQSDTLAIQHTIPTEIGEQPITSLLVGPVINIRRISGVDISGDVTKDTPNPPITTFRWEKDE